MTVSDAVAAHVARILRVRVRGGFDDPEVVLASIPDLVVEQLGHADEALEARLAEGVRAELDALAAEMRTWPKTTTNDAIVIAFAKLGRVGIVALEDAGGSMGDAWDAVDEAARGRPKARGATFYHAQDLERGVDGAGLFLAFGCLPHGDPDEQARTLAIGHEVAAALRKEKVAIEWDETTRNRIHVLPFPWQRRLLPR